MSLIRIITTAALALCNQAVGTEFDNSSGDEEEFLFEDDMIESEYDPLEPVNRLMFSINECLDKAFFIPIAVTYKTILPGWFRKGIDNVVCTVFAPVRVVNFVLQGDVDQVVRTVVKTVFNLIFGFFGTCDVAKVVGITSKETSLGDTLKKWGVKPGPYVVVPVLGPSSLRGLTGKVFQTPIGQLSEFYFKAHNKSTTRIKIKRGVHIVDLVATRASLIDVMNDLERTSIDKYIAIRGAVMSREK